MDDDRSRTLEFRVNVEKFNDRITGRLKIVVVVRFVVMRQQVVIEEDGVVARVFEKYFRLGDVRRDV